MKWTEFLKKRRDVLDLTQEELAQRLGTTTAYVGLMESGQRRPKKVTSLEKLRTALEVEEADSGWFFRFMTYDEKPEYAEKYLNRSVFYETVPYHAIALTEESPVYQAFTDAVNCTALDREQLVRLLTILSTPDHPLAHLFALLLEQPDEIAATLLKRLQFELELLHSPPDRPSLPPM